MRLLLFCLLCFTAPPLLSAQPADGTFTWPDGKQAALSLSFDDARLSQIDVGLGLFDELGAKATFYVVPSAVEQRLDGWKRAAAAGHEIANHSLVHPCSGNFPWSRDRALETYSLEQMERELEAADARLETLLGVRPASFAYPCGQTFVGRGVETRSYVPVVAARFTSGRGWLDEAPNDPTYCDLAQLTGMEMDGKTFDELRPLLESTREAGHWLVLAGHEIGTGGRQTTLAETITALVRYAQDPANGIWLAPVGDVAAYVLEQRGEQP